MNSFDNYLTETKEIGFVEESNHSIIYASGLPNVTVNEIVLFENGSTGLVLSMNNNFAEILTFTNAPIKNGMRVTRTRNKQEMPVGHEYLGLTVDPFGLPMDKLQGFRKPNMSRPIHVTPSGISNRKRIEKPFETGVTLVDFLIPIGKGQRELVIGDRKTGKTAFLHQTILSQAKMGTVCIYAAIGKKKMDIKKSEEFFKKMGISQNTVIIGSGSDDPAGVIYLTPYCAMTLGEYFLDEGHDVLVVLDDLLTHAKFYREIALIGKRFPGRNSYPADIFYTHARLLERGGNFIGKDGQEHSITCLPVVESVQGDIAGFIQTNLMSMTDGHIFFDVDLFARGQRPAINPFISVSRVGRQTQSHLRMTMTREVLSFLTLRQRLENFSHFGTEASPQVKNTLEVGNRILTFFTQNATEVMDVDLQTIIFGLIWQGIWEDINTLEKDLKKIRTAYKDNAGAKQVVKEIIDNSPDLNVLLITLRNRALDLFKELNIVIEGKVALFARPTAPALTPVPSPAPLPNGNTTIQTEVKN